jgi:death on curing protein
VQLHHDLIELYGGAHGLRDPGLLESAVMAPQQTFGGAFLYQSLTEIGVAYWIGLVGNHPFIDGNKRIGLLAFDTFMLMNDLKVMITNHEAIEITLSIARGEADRDWIVKIIDSRLTDSLGK